MPTTWSELLKRGWLDPACTHQTDSGHFLSFVLTGEGWFAGIKLLGLLDNPDFQKQMSRLSAALKHQVKSRNGVLIGTQQIAKESGLEFAFVHNAIACHLLDPCFRIQGPRWAKGCTQTLIEIPGDYGQEPL